MPVALLTGGGSVIGEGITRRLVARGWTVAVADIRMTESLSPIRPIGADFYSRREGDLAGAGLKVWSREKPIPLSERVPVLENMGFKVVDERTHRIEPGDIGAEVWLHDMLLERADGAALDIEALKPENISEDVREFFKDVDTKRGDALIGFGWAMAELLAKFSPGAKP